MHTFMKIAMPVVAALSLGMVGCIGAEVDDESEPGVAQEAVIRDWSAPEQRCTLGEKCSLRATIYHTERNNIEARTSYSDSYSVEGTDVQSGELSTDIDITVIVLKDTEDHSGDVSVTVVSDDDPYTVVTVFIPYTVDLPCERCP